MPELPDVEGFRRCVARHAAGHRVERVAQLDGGVLRNTTIQGLGRAVKAGVIREPRRTGKWLIIPMGHSFVVMHFGMTGGVTFTSGDPGPRFDRVVFHLDCGELHYHSQRKFGGIWLAREQREIGEITGPLGPDALSIGRAAFRERLHVRKQVKSALMTQESLAGIGNELSDEILWRAGIHPARRASDLEGEAVDRLYDAMGDVLRQSVRAGQIPRTDGWLNSVRGLRDARCPRCHTRIERSRVGGRTAYWCPHCQPPA